MTTSLSRSTYSTEHINVSDVLNVSPVMVKNSISGAEFPLDFSVSPEQAANNTVEIVIKRIVHLSDKAMYTVYRFYCCSNFYMREL